MSAVELQGVVKRFGTVTAVDRLSFAVGTGQCVSLLGPSGCGKTTTLRMIAGFEQPDAGTVLVGGRDMRGRRPYERNVGLVFQDYALFPHMTVADNVAYGLRQRRMPRAEAARRVEERLAQVKLAGFGGRRPAQLSGGEQQRVALARALAIEPDVLLLDEPLSNLDAKLRQELRIELRGLLTALGTTAIFVTHDQEEAMTLSDHVVIINRGRIEQQGTPVDIYARPANRFVAEFIGRTNWFSGKLAARAGTGWWRFEASNGIAFVVACPDGQPGLPVDVAVRPERLVLEPGPGGPPDARNRLHGTLDIVEYLGADIHHWVRLDSGYRMLVVQRNVGQPLSRSGVPVTVAFEPDGCIVLPVR